MVIFGQTRLCYATEEMIFVIMRLEVSMRKQKRVAVINDVTGFGRCAAAVAQPIISAMKIQCCVLPTAIFSVHTGFPDYFLHDFTPYLKEYMGSGIQESDFTL